MGNDTTSVLHPGDETRSRPCFLGCNPAHIVLNIRNTAAASFHKLGDLLKVETTEQAEIEPQQYEDDSLISTFVEETPSHDVESSLTDEQLCRK